MLFKDNSLTTVLMLVVVGYLIYTLLRPGNCMENTKEDFANQEQEEKQQRKEERQERRQEARQQEATTLMPVSVNQEIIQQALAESISNASKDVFQFEGASNDNDSGASLDAAFERPVASQPRAENVNMKEQDTKKYNAADFLPKEVNSEWFNTDFSQAKVNVDDTNLINTERYVIGVNTVGQSLKNASYDIRGTIANPKFAVSPWNNSTYEPDTNIKPLC
jgi:hypothetical protein